MGNRIVLPFPAGTVVCLGIRVDRIRTPQKVIRATGFGAEINDDALVTILRGEGDVVDVYSVPIPKGHIVKAGEEPAFLAQYGLVPDPYAQVTMNEANRNFSSAYPNGTKWGSGYLVFDRWRSGGWYVPCRHSDYDWRNYWFLSGVPAPR